MKNENNLVFEILSLYDSTINGEESVEDKKNDKKPHFEIGDILDTRKTNKDFRRWAARIRRINKDGTALVEYTDGQIKDYVLNSDVKIMPLPTLKYFLSRMNDNIERGSLSGPTIEKVQRTLDRWIEKYQNNKN